MLNSYGGRHDGDFNCGVDCGGRLLVILYLYGEGIMSHYCKDHPKYEAKREPYGSCRLCWKLWFYRNPEAKEVLQREYREAEDLLTGSS